MGELIVGECSHPLRKAARVLIEQKMKVTAGCTTVISVLTAITFNHFSRVHITQSVAGVKKSSPLFENHLAHVELPATTTQPLALAPVHVPSGVIPKLLHPCPTDVHRAAAAATAAVVPS